jgi:hypothetical protein
MLTALDADADATLWRTYNSARSESIARSTEMYATMRSLPQVARYSDAAMVKELLPYPDLFSGVSPSQALLPIIVIDVLLAPADPAEVDGHRLALDELFGGLLSRDLPPLPILPGTSVVDA